jgi:hypothetical protein
LVSLFGIINNQFTTNQFSVIPESDILKNIELFLPEQLRRIIKEFNLKVELYGIPTPPQTTSQVGRRPRRRRLRVVPSRWRRPGGPRWRWRQVGGGGLRVVASRGGGAMRDHPNHHLTMTSKMQIAEVKALPQGLLMYMEIQQVNHQRPKDDLVAG